MNLKENTQGATSKTVDISSLKPGNNLSDSIIESQTGRCLATKGTTITEGLISSLEKWQEKERIIFHTKDVDQEDKGLISFREPITEVGIEITPYLQKPDSLHKEARKIKNELENSPELGEKLAAQATQDFKNCIQEGETYKETIYEVLNILTQVKNRDNKSTKLSRNKAAKGLEKLLKYYADQTYEILLDTHYPDPLAYTTMLKGLQGDYTYLHSLNVTKWALPIVTYMNTYNKLHNITEEGKTISYSLKEVALSSILHDAGKLHPEIQELIYQPRKLNPDEMDTIKTHPHEGYMILRNYEKLFEKAEENTDPTVLQVALQHHEKPNQDKSYPYGLKPESINPISAAVTVADIFEALFFRTLYRENPLPAKKVGEIMFEEIFGEQAEEMKERYIKQGGKYSQGDIQNKFFPPMATLINLTEGILLNDKDKEKVGFPLYQ